jgi:protein SCO1/2
MHKSLIAASVAASSTLPALTGAQAFDQPVGSAPTPKIDRTKVRIDQRLGNHLPEQTSFLDREGHEVRVASLLHSRPLLVLPIFHNCTGVCNLELQSLLKALPSVPKRIGRDFDILVLSIDPNEGPKLAKQKCAATLAAAPGLKGTGSGWHFWTGPIQSVRNVTNALGFYYTYDAKKDLINHPSGMMIVTQDGIVSSYMLGADYDPGKLTANLNLATKSKVGKKAPDVFFGCIHVDPVTGRRSIVIENFLKVAGIATILAISGTIGILSIGKRRRRRRSS